MLLNELKKVTFLCWQETIFQNKKRKRDFETLTSCLVLEKSGVEKW